MIVEGIRRAAPSATTALRSVRDDFAVLAGATPSRGPAAAAPARPLDGILALQEQAADAARDRQARQHGQALLQALSALQHALLAGEGEGTALQALATLTTAGPPAADPVLGALIQALSLRAQVELARRDL